MAGLPRLTLVAACWRVPAGPYAVFQITAQFASLPGRGSARVAGPIGTLVRLRPLVPVSADGTRGAPVGNVPLPVGQSGVWWCGLEEGLRGR